MVVDNYDDLPKPTKKTLPPYNKKKLFITPVGTLICQTVYLLGTISVQ